MNGNYQVGSGRIVAVSHDTPFITNSILDSGEKSNPSEESSSQEVGEAQFSLAKSEDGKAHPYTKIGAEIVRGLAAEKAGILVVALTKIEADVMGDTITGNRSSTRLLSTSTYSIPRFVKKINPKEENGGIFVYSYSAENTKRVPHPTDFTCCREHPKGRQWRTLH